MPPMARAVRRLLLLDAARVALGGGARLAAAMGIGRRAVNHKLVADRGLTDDDLAMVAEALDRRAKAINLLAGDIRAMIAMAEVSND